MESTNKPVHEGSSQTKFLMRTIEQSDAKVLADWYQQIEDVSIFDRQTPMPANSSDVGKIVESMISNQKKNKCCWYVAENEQGDLVGLAGLELINSLHGNALLPVFIAPKWRRTGVGARMCGVTIDLAFKQLRLHRVATLYRSDNSGSRRLVKLCGFQEEGVSRQAWFSNGKYYDVINASILATEWEMARVKLIASLEPDVTMSLGPRASSRWVWPSQHSENT